MNLYLLIAEIAALRLQEYGISEAISIDVVKAVHWASTNASVELLSAMRVRTMTQQECKQVESSIIDRVLKGDGNV